MARPWPLATAARPAPQGGGQGLGAAHARQTRARARATSATQADGVHGVGDPREASSKNKKRGSIDARDIKRVGDELRFGFEFRVSSRVGNYGGSF